MHFQPQEAAVRICCCFQGELGARLFALCVSHVLEPLPRSYPMSLLVSLELAYSYRVFHVLEPLSCCCPVSKHRLELAYLSCLVMCVTPTKTSTATFRPQEGQPPPPPPRVPPQDLALLYYVLCLLCCVGAARSVVAGMFWIHPLVVPNHSAHVAHQNHHRRRACLGWHCRLGG